MFRSGFPLARATAAALLFGLLAGAGCSPRSAPPRPRASAPAAPDTLLLRLAPRLEEWFQLWRRADPAFEPGRLQRVSQGPFTLHDIRRYDPRSYVERRRRHFFGVFAPDSERFLDPDRGFDVDAGSGVPVFAHGPDSSAALVDLRARSIATIEPVGPLCAADGALWLDPLRFALTGTVATDDSSGMRCGFVLAYDLGGGVVTEYRTPAVDSTAFRRFLTARESAWFERMRGPAD